MKKILYLFAIAILVVSCGQKSSESYFIPKNAIGVMYINLESLSKKSSDVDFKSLSIHKMIEENAPKEMKQFMDEHMTAENINATFRKELVLGFMSVNQMTPMGGLILPIKDAASFEKMIKPMLDQAPGIEKQEGVGKGSGFTVYSNREMAIGWDNTTALIIGAQNFAGQELIDLTNLSSDESINSANYFSSFLDKGKDMGLHISSTPLSRLAAPFLMGSGVNMDLKNNDFVYYSTFEEDRVLTEAKLKMNDDFKEVSGYEKWMSTDYDASLLNMMPNDASMVMKFSVDPTAMYKHFEGLQDSKVFPEMAKGQLKMGLRQMNREMKREIGMTMEEVAGIFEGTMMMGMTKGVKVKDSVYTYNYDGPEYEVYEREMPYMYVALSIKDQAKFDNILNMIMKKEAPMETKGKNYFQLEKDAFLVIKDGKLFFTNNGAKADEVYNSGKLASNLSGFEHKSKMSNSMYMYMKSDFYKAYSGMLDGLNPYARYGNGGLDMASMSDTYMQYFGDSHVTMGTDGMEMYSYTKGEGNSLVRMIMYSDALVKEMSKMMPSSY
ncbi:hypothetical protein [uncultured Kordia sp.]|uniref:hypothetical protein n=1 Tax=uncultured Kordia sp. TaxID=507699 RepID=UPI00263103FA|nr:hypothetical protein [uncultured Kordia sp.]